MSGQTFICTPGQSFIPLGTQHDVCKCKHERLDHWMGGGDCGECKRCCYFRPVAASLTTEDPQCT